LEGVGGGRTASLCTAGAEAIKQGQEEWVLASALASRQPWDGGMAGGQDGRMAGWQDGGTAEWQDGGIMAGWREVCRPLSNRMICMHAMIA